MYIELFQSCPVNLTNKNYPMTSTIVLPAKKTVSQKPSCRFVNARRLKANIPKPRLAGLNLVGQTPVIELESSDINCRLVLKCEFLNCMGNSAKSRMAKEIGQPAFERGSLRHGMKILEVTSGNTGIAFTEWARLMGFGITLLVGSSTSARRVAYLEELGARVITFDASKRGYEEGIRIRDEMMAAEPGKYWTPDQFENPSNWIGHLETTGPEIMDAIGHSPDAFVSGYGTGGTIVGCGYALKKENPKIKIVPAISLPCPFGEGIVEGIAPNGFKPKILKDHESSLNLSEPQEVLVCEAFEMCRHLHRQGLNVGVSSGLNVVAALYVGRSMPAGSVVCTVLCDGSELYEEAFVRHQHS